jgi:hypothetical protein
MDDIVKYRWETVYIHDFDSVTPYVLLRDRLENVG